MRVLDERASLRRAEHPRLSKEEWERCMVINLLGMMINHPEVYQASWAMSKMRKKRGTYCQHDKQKT
jgi:hypothetical protein